MRLNQGKLAIVFEVVLMSSMLAGRAQQATGNAAVLSAANSFSDGGGYTTKPKPSGGSPEKIVFKGETLRERSTNGTYCSGFWGSGLRSSLRQEELAAK
jgi:hypothetical protein